MVTYTTIRVLTPEVLVIVTGLWIYVVGAFLPRRGGWALFGAVGFLAAGWTLSWQAGEIGRLLLSNPDGVWLGPVVHDVLGWGLRLGSVLLGLLLLGLLTRSRSAGSPPEVIGTLMMLIAGMMLVAGAGELVLLFVGLELISVSTYVLLFLGRPATLAREATVKYFLLSVLASALLLYGLSQIYGSAGSTSLAEIARHFSATGASTSIHSLAALGILFAMAGLGFKITAAPFHFYAPDVYQGTSSANAAVLSVVPKVAGLVALVRLLDAASPALGPYAWPLIALLAVMSMTVGNVVALWQNDVRRLMAYSSIAHAGYMLLGLAIWMSGGDRSGAAATTGVSALLVYLAAYAVATIAVFAALGYLGGKQRPLENVGELAGLSRSHPGAAAALCLSMFSLAGIPPLVGFWGKLVIFAGALSVAAGPPVAGISLRHWFVVLAVIGVLNAAIAAAYYLRVVGVVLFRPQEARPSAEGGAATAGVMAFCSVLLVALGCFPGPLVRSMRTMAAPLAANLPIEGIRTATTSTGTVDFPRVDAAHQDDLSNRVKSMSQEVNPLVEEVQELVWSIVDEEASEADIARLESLLKDDEQAREVYIRCMQLHADLHYLFRHKDLPLPPLESATKKAVPPVSLPTTGTTPPSETPVG